MMGILEEQVIGRAQEPQLEAVRTPLDYNLSKMTLKEIRQLWIIKLLSKWVWILGFFPLLLDFLVAYIPTDFLPSNIQSFLAKGTSWSTTIALFVIGLLISAYLVAREDQNTIRSLNDRLQDTIAIAPDIHVLLSYNGDAASRTIQIPLPKKPPEPDYDSLVDTKRKKLEGKAPSSYPSGSFYERIGKLAQLAAASAMQEPNPNYEREVDEHLQKFRDYLEVSYELKIDRAFSIKPFVVNKGQRSATSGILKLIMPQEYQKPEDHHKVAVEELDEYELLVYTNPPVEPEPYRSRLETLATIPHFPDLLDHAALDIETSYDPAFDLIDGEWRISYRLGELVPKMEIRDLEPFIIWAGDVEVGDEWTIVAKAYATELSEPHTIELTISFVSAS